MKIAIYRLAVLGLLLLGWWAASRIAGANLVPTPGETLAAAGRLLADGRILTATMESLRVYFGGYLLAALIGIPLGLAMGAIRDLGRTLEVYVNALMATPRVAFIPLIIVFLGLGPEAKIVVVFLGAVMPILVNTYAGILNSDDELIEMARSVGASRPQIYLPHHAARRAALRGRRAAARRDDRADQHRGRRALHRRQRPRRPSRALRQHLPDGALLRRGAGARARRRRRHPGPAATWSFAPAAGAPSGRGARWGYMARRAKRGEGEGDDCVQAPCLRARHRGGPGLLAAPGGGRAVPAHRHRPRGAAGAELGHGSRRCSSATSSAKASRSSSSACSRRLRRWRRCRPAKARWRTSRSMRPCSSSPATSWSLKAVVSPNKSLPFLIAAKDDIATPESLDRHELWHRPGWQPRPLAEQ